VSAEGEAGRDGEPLLPYEGEVVPVAAFAPAGIGNLAAGFDVLGAAVLPLDGQAWGDVVEVRRATADALVCVGPFAHRLPARAEDNLIWRAHAAFAAQLGRALPPLAFVLHKNLPVASGLGSSAASVAATLRALNESCGCPLSERRLLTAAGAAESSAAGAVHLDNVAPALLGGLRLIDPDQRAHALPFPEELVFVLWVPALVLETRVARRVLPPTVSLGLAVAHAQNLASFLHALHTRDLPLLGSTLRDLLAEPHRAGLVPGFRDVQAAVLAAGALGASLSGSGPAVFAVVERERAASVAAIGESAWRLAGVSAAARICQLDGRGARLVTAPDAAANP
jgi:homoserine kinase